MRIRSGMGIVIVSFALGCSGSGIGTDQSQQAARLAAHFDSLYFDFTSRGTGGCSGDRNARLGCTVFYVETPTAYGATPTDVDVQINNVTEKWHGVQTSFHQSHDGGATFDTTYRFAVYRNPDLSDYFVIYAPASGRTAMLFSDTSAYQADSVDFSTAAATKAGSCAVPDSVEDPTVNEFLEFSCTPATFISSGGATFRPNDGEFLILVHFASQSFSGEQFDFVDSAGASPRRTHVVSRVDSIPLSQ